jgi:hypothetical protein
MTDTLICSPWTGHGVRGSIKLACADCERAIEVAPTGQARLATGDIEAVCIPCGQVRIVNDPEPKVAPVSAEQLAEIRRHFTDDA